MKTIKVIIEEPSHPVINFQNTRKKGRPKNITKKIKIGGFELGRLPHDLYLELVNLKSDGIDHFVRKYQPLLPEQVKGSNFSTNNDIQKFQKELRSIYGGIKVFNKFHRNSLAHTLLLLRRKTNNLDLLVNKYLKYCHLDLELAPIIQEQLSPDQLSKHQKQIQDFDKESSGFLRDDVLNHPKRGFNISLFPGEDPEFFSRVKQQGMKIAYSPELIVFHRRRTNLKGFCRQFYLYGKSRFMKEAVNKEKIKPFFLIPYVFVIYFILGGILGIFYQWFLLPIALYFLIDFIVSLWISLQKGLHRLPLLFLLFFLLHFSYWLGMIVWFFGKRK